MMTPDVYSNIRVAMTIADSPGSPTRPVAGSATPEMTSSHPSCIMMLTIRYTMNSLGITFDNIGIDFLAPCTAFSLFDLVSSSSGEKRRISGFSRNTRPSKTENRVIPSAIPILAPRYNTPAAIPRIGSMTGIRY